MEHPLIGNLSQLKDEELQEKITELTGKLNSAYRMGNSALIGQLTMALESYKNHAKERRRANDNDSHSDKIDIS